MKFAIFILTICFSIACANAQPGCTDPQALNYDPAAVQNDGSCMYPDTYYVPTLVALLPESMTEASGLAFVNGQLWAQQDGGDLPQLYHLDTLNGALLQTTPLPLLENQDWEDLAEDDMHLYIGDFGNNAGNRTDLRIYKINKNDLLTGSAAAEVIQFAFSDQTDFTPGSNATNHDCEAFVVLGDSLHLFTKRWLDNRTHRYTLPNSPGNHVAQLKDSLDVGMLVTAADVSTNGMVLLLGYDGTTSETSFWMLWDFPGTAVFAGNKRKINLGTALNMAQAEGLAFSTPTTGFICSERISFLPQRLLRFEVGQWLLHPTAVMERPGLPRISTAPNPFDGFLVLDYQGVGVGEGRFCLLGTEGRTLRSGTLRSGKNEVDTTGLAAGMYLLLLENEGGLTVRKLVKI